MLCIANQRISKRQGQSTAIRISLHYTYQPYMPSEESSPRIPHPRVSKDPAANQLVGSAHPWSVAPATATSSPAPARDDLRTPSKSRSPPTQRGVAPLSTPGGGGVMATPEGFAMNRDELVHHAHVGGHVAFDAHVGGHVAFDEVYRASKRRMAEGGGGGWAGGGRGAASGGGGGLRSGAAGQSGGLRSSTSAGGRSSSWSGRSTASSTVYSQSRQETNP